MTPAPDEPKRTLGIVAPVRDDRVERMMADPESYFAEARERAQMQAREDIALKREVDRRRRRARLPRWLRWLA